MSPMGGKTHRTTGMVYQTGSSVDREGVIGAATDVMVADTTTTAQIHRPEEEQLLDTDIGKRLELAFCATREVTLSRIVQIIL